MNYTSTFQNGEQRVHYAIHQHSLLPSHKSLHEKVERVQAIVSLDQTQAKQNFEELYRQKIEREMKLSNPPIKRKFKIVDLIENLLFSAHDILT